VTGRDAVAAAAWVPRSHTSGQPVKRPLQTVWQTEHVHAVAPAFIGWSQPLVIWHPNSWHQPILSPS
jgi:hypothetical protein